MAITISPNTNVTGIPGFPICFQASSIINIPQEDTRCIDLPSSGINWTFDSSTCIWQRISGSNGTFTDAQALSTDLVDGRQPFSIFGVNGSFDTPASPNRFFASQIGVLDDTGIYSTGFYGWYLWKNCGSQDSGHCSGDTVSNKPDQNWKAYIISQGIIVYPMPVNVNMNEVFRIRSDGATLFWDWQSAGVWYLAQYSIPLPTSNTFQFYLNSAYNNNKWHQITTFKGTYQGPVPITWTTPLGGSLDGTNASSTRCFTADSIGTYSVCVESAFDSVVCVDVEIAALTLAPVDVNCGDCVFTDTTVKFTSNGGLNGTLTAVDTDSNPVGTVIDALTWEAPSSAVDVVFTYTLDSSTATCSMHVIDGIKVANIVGDTITGLVPGDEFQIQTNYGFPSMIWENLDCPNIVSPEGLITIPRRLNDDCFGALDCYIRGRLVDTPDHMCPNIDPNHSPAFVEFRIITDPVYPTPVFGGPKPIKWKPETPDYRVLINTFEGGCDETYLRNRVAVYRWTIRYDGLALSSDNPCAPTPCCDETLGFIDGFDQSYQVAKRLDDFWNLVAGNAGYFTLVDYRTGEVWKRARFDGTVERDHINWLTTVSRDVKIIWSPCCASGPMGGICTHNSTSNDVFPPSKPQDIGVEIMSPYRIDPFWTASTDNVGIKGYNLAITHKTSLGESVTEVIDVSNVLRYHHENLQPRSKFSYKVQAYDFNGNLSDWSYSVSGTTDSIDLLPPTVPISIVAATISDSEIDISWAASADLSGVAGYLILIDGYVTDLGNVTSYHHTGLTECSSHSYYVRSYDIFGNKSAWSDEVIGTTSCGDVSDGGVLVTDSGVQVVEG